MFKGIKLDKADVVFSKFIRTRDNWTCQRCGKYDPPPNSGLQNSHYFGRGKESTRFSDENCDTLCFGCHQYWGSTDREGYRNFKLKQLGQAKFDRLLLLANTIQKKDRYIAYLICKKKLEDLEKKNDHVENVLDKT